MVPELGILHGDDKPTVDQSEYYYHFSIFRLTRNCSLILWMQDRCNIDVVIYCITKYYQFSSLYPSKVRVNAYWCTLDHCSPNIASIAGISINIHTSSKRFSSQGLRGQRTIQPPVTPR